jgi:hypothetical protein
VAIQCSLTLVRLLSSTCGRHLCHYVTLEFISPTAIRSAIRREKGGKYNNRKDTQAETTRRKEMRKLGEDDLAVSKVFA